MLSFQKVTNRITEAVLVFCSQISSLLIVRMILRGNEDRLLTLKTVVLRTKLFASPRPRMGLEFLLPIWLSPFVPLLPLELFRRLGNEIRTMAIMIQTRKREPYSVVVTILVGYAIFPTENSFKNDPSLRNVEN